MTQNGGPVGLRDTPAPAPAPARRMTPEQIRIVKTLAPQLQEHAVAITTIFYKNILNDAPVLKNMFNRTAQSTGAQPRALANAIIKYVNLIDNLPLLSETIERIAHKHVSLQVEPGMYDLVGKYLLQALHLIFGDVVMTATADDAWNAAYGVLAGILIAREHDLYSEAGSLDANPNGWVGYRKFRVGTRKNANESGTIVSFTLLPMDGKPLPHFTPGQYVSVQLFVPELGFHQSRQYSLSQGPGNCTSYQISVKRIDASEGKPAGLFSNMMHALGTGDSVAVSQPQGEFVVRENERFEQAGPLVLLSAGVGATPLKSILDEAVREMQQVIWLHVSHDGKSVPFWQDVKDIVEKHPGNAHAHLWLTNDKEFVTEATGTYSVIANCRPEVKMFSPLDRERYLRLSDQRTGYYICGPTSFMLQSRSALAGFGVPPERIHVELFATGEV